MRQALIEVSAARGFLEGQQTKESLLYAYMTGPQFRHRVEAVVDRMNQAHDDLAKEKQYMKRMWAKRENHIDLITEAMVGMYGDLEGIAGNAMPEIEGLETPLIEGE